MHHSTPYYLAFQKLGLGAGTLRQLQSSFPDIDSVWRADRNQLSSTGASDKLVDLLIARRPTINPATLSQSIVQTGIAILGLDDPNYPRLLRETHSPPLVLFVRGNQAILRRRCVTVVGTRQMSRYGAAATNIIIPPLAGSGVSVVSGLAFGIDACAHTTALEHNIPTVAVLGSSVEQITPVANHQLGQRILNSNGAIISEYPPGTTPQKHHFPQRNRILAGLSRATVVVEAGQTSGALITAKFALEEGRDVFAVPGPITAESSAGTNDLLRHGAAPITSASDLQKALGLDITLVVPENMPIDELTETEAAVLALLRQLRHVDELVAMSRLDASVVNATLSILELKGLVGHLGGMHYVRTP